MNVDTDLQVWLETQAQSKPGFVVPYVQSSEHKNLRYLLRTTVEHQGSHSRVSQGGALDVPPHTAVALPGLSINQPDGSCRIELFLTEKMGAEKHYEFDCSTPQSDADGNI